MLVAAVLVAVATWGAVVAREPAPARVGSLAGFSPGGTFTRLPAAELARDLDLVVETGARWVRVDLAWTTVEPVRGAPDWTAFDRVLDAAQVRGLDVLALVAYAPPWARPGCATHLCPPDDAADYAGFLAAAVARYGPERVAAWELWNEPNVAAFWAPRPDVDAYAELLTVSARAARAVRPEVVLVSGGLAPAVSDGTDVAPVDFVRELYERSALREVDAVGIHPYSATALPLAVGTEQWNTFLQMQQVHAQMTAAGDADKRVWGTEYGVSTGTSSRSASEQHQADAVEQAFRHLGNRTWPWLGPLFVYAIRDSGDDLADWQSNFGVLRHDGRAKPAVARLTEVLAEPLAVPSAAPSAAPPEQTPDPLG